MKLVYLESTIGLINKIDPKKTADLIKLGEVKKTRDGVPYLLIDENRDEKV